MQLLLYDEESGDCPIIISQQFPKIFLLHLPSNSLKRSFGSRPLKEEKIIPN